MLIQGNCQVKNMRKVEKLLGIITNGYSTQHMLSVGAVFLKQESLVNQYATVQDIYLFESL